MKDDGDAKDQETGQKEGKKKLLKKRVRFANLF